MPGCVLRACGEHFDVDAYLAHSGFQPCSVSRRGQPRRVESTRIEKHSGFNLVVSDADGDKVPLQIREARAFLEAHHPELQRLREWPGVDSLVLDFGWCFPVHGNGQWNRFPAHLLRKSGELGIDIEVSVYAVRED